MTDRERRTAVRVLVDRRAILDRRHEEGYDTKVIDRHSADLRERFPSDRIW